MDISISNIEKKYGNRTVLKIDSLQLKEHRISGIIGPNGSGKSTLLRIIAGLDREYTGNILIEGQVINEKTYKAMTLVFQKPYLLNTDVYNNIAYPLKLRGISKDKIKEKVHHMIELLQLKEIIQQNARTLSGGEGQKVALARAIVFEPKLLLLDEPTSNIDPQSMQLLEKAITHVNKSCNTTVVLVTHNIRQLQRVCADAAFMREGKVEELGSTAEVLSNLKGTYLGEFLDQEIHI